MTDDAIKKADEVLAGLPGAGKLTKEQADRFVEYTKEFDDHDFFVMCVACGLRAARCKCPDKWNEKHTAIRDYLAQFPDIDNDKFDQIMLALSELERARESIRLLCVAWRSLCPSDEDGGCYECHEGDTIKCAREV